MSNLSELFIENVKRRMGSLEMTQADLAEAAGMAQPAINRYLTGKTEPGFDAICRLAAAMKCQPWQLLKPSDAKESPLIAAIVTALPALDDEKLRAVLAIVRSLRGIRVEDDRSLREKKR